MNESRPVVLLAQDYVSLSIKHGIAILEISGKISANQSLVIQALHENWQD